MAETLSGWVASKRDELRLTQEELAAKAQISPRTVRRIEGGGGVNRRTLRKLEAILGPAPANVAPPVAAQEAPGAATEGKAIPTCARRLLGMLPAFFEGMPEDQAIPICDNIIAQLRSAPIKEGVAPEGVESRVRDREESGPGH